MKLVALLFSWGFALVAAVQPLVAQSPPPPAVNGWEFHGAVQGNVDTVYTRLIPNGGIDTCQMFGYRIRTVGTVLAWEKSYPDSFSKPDFFAINVRLEGDSLPENPGNFPRFWLFAGNADSVYPMGTAPQRWFQLAKGVTSWWANMTFTTIRIPLPRLTRIVLWFTITGSTPEGAQFVLNDLRGFMGDDRFPRSWYHIERFGEALNTASVNLISDAVPRTFTLGQNYPNPFNPSTVITFQVVSSKFTTLKVYNLIGQEVATLVNEKLRPGSYETTWDAAGMSSGTYIYRLSTDAFVETRKMVLLK